jgi:hypothetical protein
LVLRVAPRVKFARGPVALAHTFQVSGVDYTLFSEDDGFDYYEDFGRGTREVLRERDVWFRNESVAVYQINSGLQFGLINTVDTIPDANRTTVQLRALGVYEHRLQNRWTFGVTALAGTYLQHRWLENSVDATLVVSFTRPLDPGKS